MREIDAPACRQFNGKADANAKNSVKAPALAEWDRDRAEVAARARSRPFSAASYPHEKRAPMG